MKRLEEAQRYIEGIAKQRIYYTLMAINLRISAFERSRSPEIISWLYVMSGRTDV